MSGEPRRYTIDDADGLIVDERARSALPASIAQRHRVVPLALIEVDGASARLVVATPRPSDRLVREPIEASVAASLRCAIDWRAASEAFIDAALAACYRDRPTSARSAVGVACERDAAPRIDGLLLAAVALGASDVHLSPAANGTRVRFRLDGRLREQVTVAQGWHALLVQRLKVLARLDVADCRRPQDGRVARLIGGERVCFRLSTFPAEGGENAVLRVQDPRRRPASLDALGLQPSELEALRALLDRPAGLLLVAGPVGCGKTTTLYALLGELDDGTRNLVTLEDPIEYPLEGVVQAAVDPSRRIDFASGTRALLRQDPDVLLVGEIRDAPTCEVVVRAALTGLRVLATVHADDAARALTRLLDLGAEPASLADGLVGIVAQRLLPRRRRAHERDAGDPRGGRFPIVECLAVDEALRGAIGSGLRSRLDAALRAAPFVRLERLAHEAVRAGRTGHQDRRRVFGGPDEVAPPKAPDRGPVEARA